MGGQRASALRFDDPRVQALLLVLVMYLIQTDGFTSKQLREPLAQLLGIAPAMITRARMTYDLRRLRLHGLIERIPKTHRFRVTADGLRISIFLSRTWARLLRPGLSLIAPSAAENDSALQRAFQTLEAEIQRFTENQKIAA